MNHGNANRIGLQLIKFIAQIAPKGTDVADVLGGLEIAKLDLYMQMFDKFGFVRLQEPKKDKPGD